MKIYKQGIISISVDGKSYSSIDGTFDVPEGAVEKLASHGFAAIDSMGKAVTPVTPLVKKYKRGR